MHSDIPQHIGYIVDGNRRWAKSHGIPSYEGHLAGYAALSDVIHASFEAGVRFVSVYVFSTENWKRSEEEVQGLMGMIAGHLEADLPTFIKNDIKIEVIGSKQGLSDKVLGAVEKAETRTAHLKRGTLVVCFNYGGQAEIADACRKIASSDTPASEITTEMIESHLYVPHVPPVDIIVRTGGDKRLSNFMLWRAAYSELHFLDKYWPDMTKEDVTAILEEYSQRNRRFGG